MHTLAIVVHLSVINVYASQDGHPLLKSHCRVCVEGPEVLSSLQCPQVLILICDESSGELAAC